MSRWLPLMVLLIAAPHLAAAQGNGRPKGPKNSDHGSSGSPAGTTLAPATTFRQFGSWLDDTSAPVAGDGYVGISAAYWRLEGMSQINMPMLSGGIGLSDRLEMSASVPFYRVNTAGTTARGIDDVYLSAKYTLIDPTISISEIGLALSPVMEMLSAGAPDGRVHFALPVSVETRRFPVRVYGSAGFFTRGALFSGGAVEWTSSRAVTVSGGLTQSYSLKDDAVLDGKGVGRRRADLTGSLAWPLTGTVGLSVSAGRTLTSIEEGGTRLSLSGGVSIRFNAAQATP